MRKIFVIVVTFNGKEWIDKCIRSLCCSSVPVDIIVVDNCSTDGTIEYITKEFPHISLIELDENIGFGPANNIGLTKSIEGNADYVFLLNQDAWIECNTIKCLISAHEKDNSFGIISPLHFNGSGEQLDKAFSSYLAVELQGNRVLASNLILRKDLEYPYSIFFVNAAAWLITRKALEMVGGFDPLFSHWGEDNNYIDRLVFNNLKVGICPNTKIYHDREDCFNDRKSFYHEYFYREKLRNLLNPGNDTGIVEITKEIFYDLLRPVFHINIKKVHEIIKAYYKIISTKQIISSRIHDYKKSYLFLE